MKRVLTIRSAETNLGTAGTSARATLWRTLQRAASALMPALGWFLLTTILSCSAWGQTYTISTLAGGGLPVNIQGTSASLGLNVPQYIAADHAGNVFFVDQNSLLRLDATTGALTLMAGNGTQGFSGDNGAATSAQLNNPHGVAVDSAGNLYIADSGNLRIRKVSGGVITTVAGGGSSAFFDTGPATSAQLWDPGCLAVDSNGDLYFADYAYFGSLIRKVSGGVLSTVAGGGSSGLGDDGPATSAYLKLPIGVAIDSGGNLYIADALTYRVRKVSNGVITTVAGNGTQGSSGDNGPATSAQLSAGSLAVDSVGNLYIADAYRIRKVSNGVIVTAAGNGTPGFSGDNGPATSAQLGAGGLAVDSSGNLYIADTFNSRIRKVTNGVITTVAGNGTQNFSGDDGPAPSAQLYNPHGVAAGPDGSLYIADSSNNRIRKVTNGVITTVAGNGTAGFSGDYGPALGAQLSDPEGVAVDSAGNLYIADALNSRVRKVSNGVITTVAGGGANLGDNGSATSAQLYSPKGVAVDSAGNLYIADTYNQLIRKVSNGVITTVAGTGTHGPSSGDNGPATSASLFSPSGVAVDSAGNLYIADTGNSRVRKVTNGIITTVAGTGGYGFSGDNGPATSAQLYNPEGITVDAAGNLYIADTLDNRIRKVSNGIITTVAGNGTYGFSGDNGPATSSQLGHPTGVAADSAGNLYAADRDNNRIRVLTPVGSSCTYSVSPASFQAPASGGNLTAGIQTAASCPWTVSALPSWITVLGASSSARSAAVTLVVAPNTGAPLSATVLIAGVSVTVTQPAASAALPTIRSVGNAASFIGGPVSPGEVVTIFGSGIGPATAAGATTDLATGKLATSIGGVQVLFNGVPAPMIYASGTQVSAVAPYEMAAATDPSVWIEYAGQISSAYQLNSAATAPGIFTQDSSGSGLGAILNQDNSLNGAGHAAAKGSIVQVYMTGEGQTNPPGVTGAITTATLPPPQVTPAPPLPIMVWINRQPALYTYAGEAPGSVAGVMQLNVQIPAGAPPGPLSILVSIGGNISQSGVTLEVQ